jgi:glucan biosynthesis protein
MAHDLSRQPWGGAPRDLPPTLANLTPQAYNSIQYDANIRCGIISKTANWTSSFSTSGWVSAAACGCSRWIRNPAGAEIHFRPELFNYNDAGVDTKQLEGQTDLGFAGFRVFKAPELARRDIVAFLGASYFRAVDSTYQYGLSARGLAVDTFTDTRKSSRTLPRSGSKRLSRARRSLPSMRCSTARASPAPISLSSTARRRR